MRTASLALGIGILSWFIPFIGIILFIISISFAIDSLKREPENTNIAISALIVSSFGIVVYTAAFAIIATYHSQIPDVKDIDMKTAQNFLSHSNLKIELLQSTGMITLKNPTNKNIEVLSWIISDYEGVDICSSNMSINISATRIALLNTPSCSLSQNEFYKIRIYSSDGMINDVEKAK